MYEQGERCRRFRDQLKKDTENQKGDSVTRISRPFQKVPPVATHEQVDERPITLFFRFNGEYSEFKACERTTRYLNHNLKLPTETWSEMYKTYLLRSAEAAYERTSLHRVRPGKDQLAVSSCSVIDRGDSFETTRFAMCLIMLDNFAVLMDQALTFNHNGYSFKFCDLANGPAKKYRDNDTVNQTA